MKSYAVIENSTVINLIVAESQEIAEHFTGKQCVESKSKHSDLGHCAYSLSDHL